MTLFHDGVELVGDLVQHVGKTVTFTDPMSGVTCTGVVTERAVRLHVDTPEFFVDTPGCEWMIHEDGVIAIPKGVRFSIAEIDPKKVTPFRYAEGLKLDVRTITINKVEKS